MNLNTRFRIATAGLVAATALGVTATACGSTKSIDGTIRPGGSRTGTFRLCAYKPVEDGVKVSEHQTTPCLLTDVREADDRKPKKRTKVTNVPVASGTKAATGGVRKTLKPTPAKTVSGPTVSLKKR